MAEGKQVANYQGEKRVGSTTAAAALLFGACMDSWWGVLQRSSHMSHKSLEEPHMH